MRSKSCIVVFRLALALALVLLLGIHNFDTVWASPCDVVFDYGADPTFTNSATIQIQNAIDDAHDGACDGEVYFPPGTYKLTDSIKPKSNVTLNISPEATLKVSENQSDLSSQFRVVYLDGVSNVVIKGGGSIDASGPFYHEADGNRVTGNRPDHLLFVKKSHHITIENITLKASVNWTFPIYDSEYLSVDKVTIRNPAYWQAHNTDGIDIVASRHVEVRNCDIETGDDAIVLKSRPLDGDTWHNLPDMYDILVEDCTVASTCNATKIGTETSNDIYGVIFRNITVNRHSNGGRNTAGINVQSNDGNWVHDIEFINYTINNSCCPIFIGLQDRDSYISGPIGKVSDITFKNINAVSDPQPILFNADEDDSATIDNVTLEDITVHNYGTEAGRVPDEMNGSYPDPYLYDVPDAYGLWARDTNGLILRGCINFIDDGNSSRKMMALWDNVTNIIDDREGPFLESGGLVVVEAENYDANDLRSDPNSINWQESSSTAGYVGDAYVDTPLPQGANATWGNACELTYQIDFGTTGIYNIWLRRYAADGATNSGYVGINGIQAGGIDNGGNYGSWVWIKMGTVSVSSGGERTFNLRRREAGYQVDRILLTADTDYTPSGEGPPESPRVCTLLDRFLWNEDFSLPNGTMSDTSPTGWTSTRDGIFEVNGNRFMITGSGGEGVWESDAIDISAGEVDISLDWQGVGSLDPATWSYGDYIRAYYQVDGGSENLIAEMVNGEEFSTQKIGENDVAGDTLRIIIRAKTTGDDEYYYFDNVSVKGGDLFQESDGLVVMEAENYDVNDVRSDPNAVNWQESSSTGGYVGDAYVDTPLPQGANATWGNACELTYRIDFGTTGSYNIWLRRYATDGATNSGFVGLNGIQSGSYDNGGNFGSWMWIKMGTVNVSSSGERTFNLRRREAGYQVDRILLTTDGDYTPSGDGPLESPRG